MDHLGERLSALVDGELGHSDRDRALRHLAACESCRFEAEMLRRLKRRLHGLDAPEPSMDFMGRLSALSGAPPADPPAGPPAGGAGPFGSLPPIGSSRPIGGGLPRRPAGPAVAVDTSPADPPAAPARDRQRRARTPQPLSVLRPAWGRARYAVAGVSVAALTLGTVYVAGGEPGSGPAVTPPLEAFAVEHAVTARQVAIPESEEPYQGAERTVHAPGEADPSGPLPTR
ncbi:anti-sigma factor family protein [Nocardiopsis sediminis]|uniref:Anti-sigma factor family protein n=1 Tax=Nocardiopsis sediminis TaxID=1778267 RepID=A0ABV8FLY8_9ACTN